MRALIVSLALAVVVVVCMAFVVLFAGLNASAAMLASIGVGIFMVAALFALIAALGPKARPTPLLTPAIAGTAAAALTTVAIIVGSTQLGQGHRAAMRTGEPAKVSAPVPDVAVAPSQEAPEAAPEPIQFPGVTIVPAGALSGLASAPPNAGATEPPPPAAPEPPARAAPMDSPVEPDRANDAAEPAGTNPNVPLPRDPSSQRAAATEAAPAAPAGTPIPIPPVPSPTPAWLILSEDVYDTSPPPTLRRRTDGASPPLPRTRPCGADGPPCP